MELIFGPLVLIIILGVCLIVGRKENIKNEEDREKRREEEREIQNTRVESNPDLAQRGDFSKTIMYLFGIGIFMTFIFYLAMASDPWAIIILPFGFVATLFITMTVIIVSCFSPRNPDSQVDKGNLSKHYDRLAETKERNRDDKNQVDVINSIEDAAAKTNEAIEEVEQVVVQPSKIELTEEEKEEIKNKNRRKAKTMLLVSAILVVSELFVSTVSGFALPLIFIPVACYNLAVNGKKNMFFVCCALMGIALFGSYNLQKIHFRISREQEEIAQKTRQEMEERRRNQFKQVELDTSNYAVELVARDFYPTLAQAEKAKGITYIWDFACHDDAYWPYDDGTKVYLQTPYTQEFEYNEEKILIKYNIWQGDGEVFVTFDKCEKCYGYSNEECKMCYNLLNAFEEKIVITENDSIPVWDFNELKFKHSSSVRFKECSYDGWSISETEEEPYKIMKVDYVDRDIINSIILKQLKEIEGKDYKPVDEFLTTSVNLEEFDGEFRKQLEAIKNAGLMPEKITKISNDKKDCIFSQKDISYDTDCDESEFIMVHFYTNKNGIKFVPGSYKGHVFVWDSYNNKIYVDSKGYGAFEINGIKPYVNERTEMEIVGEVTKEFIESISR